MPARFGIDNSILVRLATGDPEDGFEHCVRKLMALIERDDAEEVKARGYNLDFKNPHTIADDHGDPEELPTKLDEAEKQAAALRDQLKAILAEALLR